MTALAGGVHGGMHRIVGFLDLGGHRRGEGKDEDGKQQSFHGNSFFLRFRSPVVTAALGLVIVGETSAGLSG